MHDLVLTDAKLYPMTDGVRQSSDTAIAFTDGVISGLAQDADQLLPSKKTLSLQDQVVLPGLIDCHTHCLYAGNRMHEQHQRLMGASYESLAKKGGGILDTVKATRAATVEELVHQTLPRVETLIKEGVTTLEIKSGYGLNHDQELKMLRAIQTLRAHVPITVHGTYLGAHSVPPDISKQDYLDHLIQHSLPVVAREGLADTVDIFVEHIAFDNDDMSRLFSAAQDLGLKTRAHVEQLSDSDGARHGANLGALSVDHLEYLSAKGIEAMTKAGTVAVMLPGAYYFLRQTQPPPVDELRKAQIPMAVATDLNPGSSPVASLLTSAHFAVVLFGLTPEEALLGVTQNAAKAMGIASDCGTLDLGKRADLTVWDIPSPEYLLYQLGGHNPVRVFSRGQEIN